MSKAGMVGCAISILCGACGDNHVWPDANPKQGLEDYSLVLSVPSEPKRDVDALFVLDDSSSLDQQTNLKNNFPYFTSVLNTVQGGLPNLHIGVVSTDLGASASDGTVAESIGSSGMGGCIGTGKAGNLQTNGTTLISGNFISDVRGSDGARSVNYTGKLEDAFSAIASLGAGGCAFEQPLEAARRALGNNPVNYGFLRPDAYLAVVVLEEEDDCSLASSTLLTQDTSALGPLRSFRCTRYGLTCEVGGRTTDEMNQPGAKDQCHSNEVSPYLEQIGDYETFFASLKANGLDDVIFATLTGPLSPVTVELRTPPAGGNAIPALAHACSYNSSSSSTIVADPAVRLIDLAKRFPRHVTESQCQQDLSGSLVNIAKAIRQRIGTHCLPPSVAQPADCRVIESLRDTEREIPACSTTTEKPCFSIEPDPMNCGEQPGVIVERTAPAPGAYIDVYCRL